MKAFILLSGGIDSMACVNFYKALNYEVECIFCDYGQPASISEKQA
jgi:7-cyano-7-deazaguanine synthase